MSMPIEQLYKRCQQHPQRIFLRQPVDGQLIDFTWQEVFNAASRLAGGFQQLGLQKGDRIAIIGKNCAEWFIADWAIMMAGMVSVPVYPTAGTKTLAHILRHSAAKLAIIGKLDNCDTLSALLSNGEFASLQTLAMPYPTLPCQFSWSDFIKTSATPVTQHQPVDDEVMTIIYTSGSTGTPKGVVLSYGAYRYASQQTRLTLGVTEHDRVISYLPLAHITERSVIEGPSLYAGCTVYFVESLNSFVADINRAQPTYFLSVPRLWNKFLANIHGKIPAKKLALLLSLPFIGKLVAKKIRRTLGLDQVKVFGSGSAPIAPDTLHRYHRLGIDISEGWGMTETGGLSCCNLPFNVQQLGTIGMPIAGTEMKVAPDGELLLRSPGLFQAYYQDPELTALSFTEDGFFRTGDRGEYNKALNAYRITGRVKELFKTEKGKYVAPVPLEAALAENDLIEQICVMGSLMPQPVAVAVLTEQAYKQPTAVVEKHLLKTLNRVNSNLEAHEKIAQIYIASEEWSIENELLTPTLKIKRAEIEQKYLPLIGSLSASPVVWQASA